MRKRLIAWGIILTILGVIGVIACIGIPIALGFSNFTDNGFSTITIICFILFIPLGSIEYIGIYMIFIGLSILVGSAYSKFVDKSLNNRCECGDTIDNDEEYCSNCGKPTHKICPECQTENDKNAIYFKTMVQNYNYNYVK